MAIVNHQARDHKISNLISSAPEHVYRELFFKLFFQKYDSNHIVCPMLHNASIGYQLDQFLSQDNPKAVYGRYTPPFEFAEGIL